MPVHEQGLAEALQTIRYEVGESSKILFVANHNIVGMDVPLLIETIFEQSGLFPRGLCHYMYWYIPGVKQFSQRRGAVQGNRKDCARCMAAEHPLLVYPGGGLEFCKSKDAPKYELYWERRKGFAQMAIQYGYTIVPVSIVGPEDMFSIWFDFPLDRIAQCFGCKPLGHNLPIVKPWKIKRQRVYFKFGEPVFTWYMQGDRSDENVDFIHQQTHGQVREGIQQLLEFRQTDPLRYSRTKQKS